MGFLKNIIGLLFIYSIVTPIVFLSMEFWVQILYGICKRMGWI